MGKFDWAKLHEGGDAGHDVPPPPPHRGGTPPPLPHRSPLQLLLTLALGLAVIYGGYFWLIRRVVVPAGKVLVLLKKDGMRSLDGDQIIIPRRRMRKPIQPATSDGTTNTAM